MDFSVAPMDDFKVVLRLDFLRQVSAIPMPSFSTVCILEKGAACMVPTIPSPHGEPNKRQLLAIQVAKGARRGEPTYLAMVKKGEATKGAVDVPPLIQAVLDENKDVMPTELPSQLPLRREVDHTIELEPGAKPPAMAPYRMSQPELEELRKQLKELTDKGMIRPSRAPFWRPGSISKEA